jgi:ligand-binding SRPBCC domain-containing protein
MSSPANLGKITPAHMDFQILNNLNGEKMFAGQIIEYHVKPIAGIKMNWVTEITHVKDKEYFVDEQRFGPYSFWHHRHSFQLSDNGVDMFDDLHYKIPFGAIGRVANGILIKKQVLQIFDYRYKKLEEIFNK